MDSETSQDETCKRKTPWEILGIPKDSEWKDIRAAFLKKARRLHPDKGGDIDAFKELQSAYESLHDVYCDGDDKPVDDTELWEELTKWVDWAGRWGKRLLGTNMRKKKSSTQQDDTEVLKLRVPWKLLEDKTQSVKIEYDGWPIRIPLSGTEIVSAAGLRIRIVPQAEYMIRDPSGNEIIESITNEPWRLDHSWLFDVPTSAISFRVCGGEWSSAVGEYGRGVYWRYVS